MPDQLDPFETFRQLLPIRILTARKGWGSFLTFDGRTHPGSEASIHLWVYLCDWELSLGSECILDSSETDASKFKAPLVGLTDATLMSVAEARRGLLSLTFDTGHRLEMRSNTHEYESKDDLFRVYLNDHCVVSYNHERGFYLEH